MRAVILLTFGALLLIPAGARAQSDEPSRPAEDGFIEPGWFAVVEEGRSPGDARFVKEGGEFHATTGPAINYFRLASAARGATEREAIGDYTVKATFREPRFMAFGDQPQPYGLAIARTDADTRGTTHLYCAASGDGTFVFTIVGPGITPFPLNGPRPQPHPAVHKAAARGAEVTQEIALSVKRGDVQCAINGTVVASYDHSVLVTPARLATTDGGYGVHIGRNTEVLVTGLTVTTP